MLKRISSDMAIDIDRIEFMEKDGKFWNVEIGDNLHKIPHFEALRIFDLVNAEVTDEDRYCG